MPSSGEVVGRMEANVRDLGLGFRKYLNIFQQSGHFTGPSLYFHTKTIGLLSMYGSSVRAIREDEFFDWLYATLTSWGMHRMGPGNTKLIELDQIKESVRDQESIIESLQSISLSSVRKSELPIIIQKVQTLINAIRVSKAKARIVANTKCIHHILPGLVPPIDRHYTYNFFYGRTNLSIPEDSAFSEMMTFLHRIAVENRELIVSCVGTGWNTSETKAIDNAIVGHGLGKNKARAHKMKN